MVWSSNQQSLISSENTKLADKKWSDDWNFDDHTLDVVQLFHCIESLWSDGLTIWHQTYL